MRINVALLFITILLLVLPTFDLRNKDELKWYKKLTGWGIMFYIAVILLAIFQIVKECQTTKAETVLTNERNILKIDVDSLAKVIESNTDTISKLRGILSSIDSKLFITNKTLSALDKTNDSMNLKILEYDRPIIHLTSAKMVKDKYSKHKYLIIFSFLNGNKSSATNVFGKCYTMYRDTLWDNGTLSVNKTDVFTYDKGFSIGRPMNLNPDSTSLQYPIYYYFSLSYSDIFLRSSYHYEVAMAMNPFNKGDYVTDLGTCRDWERLKIKGRVDNLMNNKGK